MSMFLAVAMQNVSTDAIIATAKGLYTESADDMPIGTAVRGNWPNAGSVLVGREYAGRLFGLPPKKSQEDQIKLFRYLSRLAETFDGEIAFIFHWYKGTLAKEAVPVKKQVRIPFAALQTKLASLEEDVRYVVFWHGWPQEDLKVKPELQ